jgi:TRAP-type transport system periplasmic protein
MRTYNQATVRIAEMLGATPVDVPMVDVKRALASSQLASWTA